MSLRRFYCDHWPHVESCFNVETSRTLNSEELEKLIGLLKPMRGGVRDVSRILPHRALEIGPRITYASPASSNMVSVCRAIGLEAVTRIEESRRFDLAQTTREKILANHRDKMTQMVYEHPLETFDVPHVPTLVQTIPALAEGISALQAFEAMHKLGIDPEYMQYYYQLVLKMRRDFTDVELFQLANANSDHSRHLFWRALLLIDGVPMPASLMEVVQRPWKNNRGNSLIAFRDNAGCILGHRARDMNWEIPGAPSRYVDIDITLHIIFTAESHNFPTLVAPYQGATTGPGGRIRDNNAFGRGARFSAGTTGYFTGNLHIPGYQIPGEVVGGDVNPRYTTPLKFLVDGSNGASDYANLIGEPFLVGFRRTFGQMVDGMRAEARKGVLFTGGVGFTDSRHVEKEEAQIGWLVIGLGGPAYPIGFGGGAASSGTAGSEEGDLNAVQRGDPKMENAVNRVLRSCVSLGEYNIIKVIHDQGAGGPANVLTELVEKLGAKLYLKNIVMGDKTMSAAQVWICEYQERYGILIDPADLTILQMFAAREGVNCEVVGEVTGDGQIEVYDSDTTTCVNLTLRDVLTDLPRQTRELVRVRRVLHPFVIPKDLEIDQAFDLVSALPSVGSKADLVYQIDGTVGGRTVMGSCQGPLFLPVGDCGVVKSSLQSTTGAATAIGEQPIVGLIDAGAGARMSVAESLTNLVGGAVSTLENVNFQANWMWAVKVPGEGARLWDAANAFAEFAEAIGVRSVGGKDSSSMSTEVSGQLAVTPGQLVASSFSDVPNIESVVSQYFKSANSVIGYLDLGLGKMRMGGSALAQALNQLGDECPDIQPSHFKDAWNAMHSLVANRTITSVHDVSDGGLYTTIVEMCLAGNRGADIFLPEVHPIRFLFNQELGWVMEIPQRNLQAVRKVMRPFGKHFHELGVTQAKAKVAFKDRSVRIMDGKLILSDAV
ncbi:MAG: phosphoribosylformylglycinamidine synthase, partial [Candidatus Pacebacteria bacterium]|nr:phosphoribosylformylglycinamidine synthase [Candidatus Paceibacterota bacterium]